MKALPPVFIDGLLYALVALFAFLETQFGSDEAAKFIAPYLLFWLKLLAGASATTTLAIKLFRSTAFADHLKKVNGGNTDFFGRQQDDKPKQ